MTFKEIPLPPDPVEEKARLLPGSAGRYRDIEMWFAHEYRSTSVWRGVRIADGLVVAMKRIVEDLWSSERELSMHLAASGAPGNRENNLLVNPFGINGH